MPKINPKTPAQPNAAPKPETDSAAKKPECTPRSVYSDPKKEVIKEVELKSYLELTRVLMGAAYGFQRRIANGAIVESTEAYSLRTKLRTRWLIRWSHFTPTASRWNRTRRTASFPGPIQWPTNSNSSPWR